MKDVFALRLKETLTSSLPICAFKFKGLTSIDKVRFQWFPVAYSVTDECMSINGMKFYVAR